MKTAHNFQVGESVDVRPYANEWVNEGELAEGWSLGWTVRAVEYEDVVVERAGIGTCFGMNRVRAAA